MRKWIGLFVLVSGLVSAPAQAGWSFKQTVRSTGGQDASAGDSDSRIRVEGGDARIDFEKMADNPIFGSGGYMLLRGQAPKGMFLVSPAKKTFSKFDPAGMAQAMAPMGRATEGSGIKIEISDVRMEKLLEEPGEPIQGLATTHYRYRKSYVMTMDMVAMKMVTAHNVLEDVWMTRDLQFEIADFGDVMKQMGGSQMFKEFEKLSAIDEDKNPGWALKRVTVDHSKPQGKGMMARMMGAKEETITTTIEISELKQEPIPESTFQVPPGFTETQFMQPGAPAPDLEDEE